MRAGIFLALLFSLVACQSFKDSRRSTSLETPKLGASVENQVKEDELRSINQDIRRLRAKDLVGLVEATPKPLPAFVNADSLYAEALRYYQEEDLGGLLYFQEQLEKSYPGSHHVDNVMYLVGQRFEGKGAYPQAIFYYDRIVKERPRSNKRPAALLRKGLLYRELNLTSYAVPILELVKKDYAGSPESFQAGMELELVRLKTQK